ncbi:Hpt domain-containing protein [Dactylosporangium sp. NBC_01737]|uniref:Hpt domain-containing protein n=1 Tax=Dactylosporangium sp. NBC_01737 TaxID=2975959 RepID=UPI002E15F305|nr:Hpt domain-containing protein [Dactylosporangium sp. NBC_01737]
MSLPLGLLLRSAPDLRPARRPHAWFVPVRAEGSLAVSDLGDIVQEFLVESHENLDQLDRDLVALEAAPGSRELLSSIFRTIHTIKGTSGFLAFNRLEKVTHVGESLLSRLRDGAQGMTPSTTDALLRMVDTVRGLLSEIEEHGQELEGDDTGVIAAVNACITDGSTPTPAPRTPAPAAAPAATPIAEVVQGAVIDPTPVVEVVVVEPVVVVKTPAAAPPPPPPPPAPAAPAAGRPARTGRSRPGRRSQARRRRRRRGHRLQAECGGSVDPGGCGSSGQVDESGGGVGVDPESVDPGDRVGGGSGDDADGSAVESHHF